MQQTQAGYRPISFSSNLFPEHERVSAWREFFGPTMFGADVEPHGERPYRQDIVLRRLPGVSLLSAVNSPVRFIRTRHMLADGRGDFGLHLNSAMSLVRQRGRDIECAAGEPILVNSAEAGSMATHDASHFLCLHIDRSELLQHVPDPENCVLQRIPRDSSTLRYLLGYIRFLRAAEAEAGEVDADISRNAGRHLADLLSLLFGAAGDSAEMARSGGLRAARTLAIKRQIGEALGDPSFGVDEVAARHGISSRSVHRLFEAEGVTFSHYVLNQRLNRACRMLGDPQHAHLLVIDIAMACGFADLSHFNRSFRRKFGETPRHFRSIPAGQG